MQLQLPRLDRMCMPLELQKPDPAGYSIPCISTCLQKPQPEASRRGDNTQIKCSQLFLRPHLPAGQSQHPCRELLTPLQNHLFRYHLLMATGPQGPTMLCGVGHERSKCVRWCNSRPMTDIFKRSYVHQQDGSAVWGSSAKPDNPSWIPGIGATCGRRALTHKVVS